MSSRGRSNDKPTSNVDEHFDALMADDGCISSLPTVVSAKDLPDWYDEELFKAGQQYYQRNLLSMGLASLVGLLAVIVIPSTLKILMFTKQSGCPASAFKRYSQTLLHIYTLYTSDIDKPTSNWWKSVNTIKWKHATSSRKSGDSGVGYITLRDMVLTQFGFLGYALTVPDKLSLTNEPHGREGLNHFWKVVGHLLGIPLRLNLCRESAAETTKLCKRLQDEVYTNWMLEPPEGFAQMIKALIEGFWCVDPMLNHDAILTFWFQLHDLKYKKTLGIVSQLNMIYRKFVLSLIGTPGIGFIVRIGFNYWLTLNYVLLEKWPVLAWMTFGRKKAEIILYPHNSHNNVEIIEDVQ